MLNNVYIIPVYIIFCLEKLSNIKDNKIDNYLKKNITNNRSVYELETPQKGTASKTIQLTVKKNPYLLVL